MMERIPDYNDLVTRHERELAKYEARLPHCEYCGEAIWEKYYEIDGKIVCEECLEDLYAHDVDTYID